MFEKYLQKHIYLLQHSTEGTNYLTTADIKKDFLSSIVGNLEKMEVDPA
jgi:hypothetical protein